MSRLARLNEGRDATNMRGRCRSLKFIPRFNCALATLKIDADFSLSRIASDGAFQGQCMQTSKPTSLYAPVPGVAITLLTAPVALILLVAIGLVTIGAAFPLSSN